MLHINGTVRLSGEPMENVQVTAQDAQCSATDAQGRYACEVVAGWSGQIRLKKPSYQFTPSSLSFQNLRIDTSQRDFAAIYDPR